MNDGEQEQRRRVVRQPRLEAHHAVLGLRAPATIASPSTSSAFANSEPRIEAWATTISPAASEKRTMKSSGRFAERRLEHAGHRRPEVRADRLRRDPDRPGEAAERRPRTTKTATGSASA